MIRRRLARTAGACVLAYVAVLVILFFGQRVLIYPHGRARPFPTTGERIDVEVSGGKIPVWWTAIADAPTVVFFHGNAEQVDSTARIQRMLSDRDLGFAAVEYPGYGQAEAGAPNETSLLEASHAGLAALAERGVVRPMCVGHSLGTGVAAEAAASGLCSQLVLIAPYTSLPDAAQSRYFFVPARWLVHDQFATLARASTIAVPTLVLHGTRDRVIPVAQGRTLAAAIPHARYIERSRGHNDILDGSTMDAIAEAARALAGG